MRNLKYGALLSALLTLDLLSKFVVTKHLKPNIKVTLLKDVLDLNYVNNPGFAFSLGSNFSNILLLIYFFSLIVIFYFFSKVSKAIQISLVVLTAGILGNGIDRLGNGSVVDFISLNHFAIFNLADCFITLSLLSIVLRQKKEG